MSNQMERALKLHHYLTKTHWKDDALVGPDPGIRLNYRIFRFVKSYFPSLPWNDDLYYVQGQAYWILANWRLFALLGEEEFYDTALACSRTMIKHQRTDGAWEYPNPEWAGRIATAEGTWGAIGLLETYRWAKDEQALASILKWNTFLQKHIGFQQVGDQLAVNYFAGKPAARVPNNTAFVLRFLAELGEATGVVVNHEQQRQLIHFMQAAQKPDGEFPYSLEGDESGVYQGHFQCYQYNAFQCLDLLRCFELSGDEALFGLAQRVLAFLTTGLAADGHAFYECEMPHRAVTYHTAVVAAAFEKATALEIGDYTEPAARAYRYVLGQQQPDGSFPHSHGDYGLLSDRRSYPRYLAMILYHLLQTETLPVPDEKEDAQTVLR
ncbi:MAG: hypothetical protein ABI700_00225 [Chloroflexota bacterium]